MARLPRGPCARLLVVAGPILLAAPVAAQDGTGRSENAASVLDGVYTESQAERGRRVYERICSLCHGPLEFSGTVFHLMWADQPLGVLFTRIRTTMPQDNPGSLRPEDYAAVVAYILKLNGIPAGERSLPAEPESLSRILFVRPPERR